MIDGKVVGCPHHILEPQRTNSSSYSEQFDNSSWGKARVSVSANQVISPDGTLNADYLEQQSGNTSSGGIFKTVTFTASTHTQSIFAKKKEKGFIALAENASASGLRYTWFDIENGYIGVVNAGHTAKIENYGNGWYRCSITYTAINTGSGFSSFYYLSDTNGSTTVVGSGGLYIWGAMREQSSYPTSYIPTNGSAVTRNAETATGSGDAATFNDSEGVLMAEGALLDVSQNFNKISISDGSSAENRIEFIYLNDNEIQIELGLTNGFNEFLNVGSSKSFNKIAVVYNSTNASVFINGFNLVTNTMSSLNGLSQLQFNRFNANTENFHGKTKQIQYYNSALTDSELEQLTSWTSFSDMANGQLYTIE